MHVFTVLAIQKHYGESEVVCLSENNGLCNMN